MLSTEPQTKRATSRVLIVDDDLQVATTLGRLLRARGYSVECSRTASEAVDCINQAHFEIVLLDVYFESEGDWRTVLDASQNTDAPPLVIMMSGRADVALAVEAMKRGATDFVVKSEAPEELFARIDRGLENAAVKRKLISVQSRKRKPIHTSNAGSSVMREALALADRVAATPSSSALIVGESGVGKEVLAERIHEHSTRHAGPFLCVNLAAISETVIEAELFGSARGAYTDAKRDRAGYLASAEGGTILLDEIGEFRTEHQAKLLRVIEERRFFPVGSDRERRVDVRILAATNRNPEEMLKQKLLRPDLYYRLGTIIRVPPLRERSSEIVPLANEFVEMYCAEFGKPRCELSASAVSMLLRHRWPGNIRELRNVIERAVMTCEGRMIGPELVDIGIGSSPPPVEITTDDSLRLESARQRALDRAEGDHIARVLRLTGGSRSAAAELLGVSRSTLYEKLKRYGIE